MTIREFYNSYAWQKQRQYKMRLENYKCASCGGVAEDVHHKIRLTEENVNDVNVSMNLDNLECLCRACHNKETLPWEQIDKIETIVNALNDNQRIL